MFRKMRRFKQQLSIEKCREILSTQWRGVLSLYGDNDYPYGVPMNFYYDENDNAVYFHCAKEGHKIDAITRHNKCSFTVFDEGIKRKNHWSLDINSVIIFGKISVVKDTALAFEKIQKFAQKYCSDKAEIEKDMSMHFAHAYCLKLSIEHISGKTVNES